MRTARHAFSALALSALLSSCSAVMSVEPIGEEPLYAASDAWEGTWADEDNVMTVKVLDESGGKLRLASVQDRENTLVLETVDVYLRKSGDWIFASLRDDDAGKEGHYLWARIKKEENTILAWLPDPEQFKLSIEKGELPGEIDEESVVLGKLEERQYEFIKSGKRGIFFEWDEPLVYFRLLR